MLWVDNSKEIDGAFHLLGKSYVLVIGVQHSSGWDGIHTVPRKALGVTVTLANC